MHLAELVNPLAQNLRAQNAKAENKTKVLIIEHTFIAETKSLSARALEI